MPVRNVHPTAANVGSNQADKNLLRQLVGAYNDLATKHAALLAKLDADAGVTDTNYVATIGEGDTIHFIGEADAPS
jgi:hypothetical protein